MSILGRINDGMNSIGRGINHIQESVKNYVGGRSALNQEGRMRMYPAPPIRPEVKADGTKEELSTGKKVVNGVFGATAAPLMAVGYASVAAFKNNLLAKQNKLEEKVRVTGQAVPILQKEVSKLAAEISELKEKINNDEQSAELQGLKGELEKKEWQFDVKQKALDAANNYVGKHQKYVDKHQKQDEVRKNSLLDEQDTLKAVIEERAAKITRLGDEVRESKDEFGVKHALNQQILEEEALQTIDKNKLNKIEVALRKLSPEEQSAAHEVDLKPVEPSTTASSQNATSTSTLESKLKELEDERKALQDEILNASSEERKAMKDKIVRSFTLNSEIGELRGKIALRTIERERNEI